MSLNLGKNYLLTIAGIDAVCHHRGVVTYLIVSILHKIISFIQITEVFRLLPL